MRIFFIFLVIFIQPVQGQGPVPEANEDYLVTISTDYGDMKLILFEDTPLHKENFTKIAQLGGFDGNLFYRVIDHFMIQGGDYYNDKSAYSPEVIELKRGLLPAEIRPHHKHVKGSLAAARTGDDVNPERMSSKTQFYIVENRKGTPHLDDSYTVFGQVMAGLNVIDSIAAQPVNEKKKPLKDIPFTVKVEKVKKEDVTRFYGYTYE